MRYDNIDSHYEFTHVYVCIYIYVHNNIVIQHDRICNLPIIYQTYIYILYNRELNVTLDIHKILWCFHGSHWYIIHGS